jgi:hypothetical protein
MHKNMESCHSMQSCFSFFFKGKDNEALFRKMLALEKFANNKMMEFFSIKMLVVGPNCAIKHVPL